jgi:hypothetical protein
LGTFVRQQSISFTTDHFRFEESDDRFGEGVVVAAPATADSTRTSASRKAQIDRRGMRYSRMRAAYTIRPVTLRSRL